MGLCSSLLLEVRDDYNRLSKHNFNFKCTQSLRLFFMLGSFVVWGILLYVWAKAIFAQL